MPAAGSRRGRVTPAARGTAAPGGRALAGALAAGLRVLAATWRTRLVGRERLEACLASRTPVLVVFWHGDFLPLVPLLRFVPGCIVSSDSRRGRVVAGIAARFGHRGEPIPEAGGEALAALRRVLGRERLVALAIDGPTGPYHVVKRGALRVASERGFAILPVAVRARWRIVLRRWDRRVIPLPFTPIAVVFGDPIEVPTGLGIQALSPWAEHVGRALADLDGLARAAACQRRPATSPAGAPVR